MILDHKHVWGPWLVEPYLGEAIVRRCSRCPAEEKQLYDEETP